MAARSSQWGPPGATRWPGTRIRRPPRAACRAGPPGEAPLDKSDPEYWRQMLEALWLHQSLDQVDEALLKQMLTCPEPRARAAATRVLCYWRDRIHEPLELLRKQVNDEHPRVRLEAVRALSFVQGPDSRQGAGDRAGIALARARRLSRVHSQRDQQDARPAHERSGLEPSNADSLRLRHDDFGQMRPLSTTCRGLRSSCEWSRIRS